MKYQIRNDENVVDVYITYKKIKSIYMRTDKKGIVVSAPIGTSWDYIEKAILKHKDKLFKNINNYKSYCDYKDDGFVLIFNELYKIKVMNIKQRKCVIHDHYLYVYHLDIQKTVEMFLRNILYHYIDERINDYLKEDFSLRKPEIEIKKYKSRWGCCYTMKNKVSFNLALVHLDKNLIDYVIVHELTHFLVPDHSKDFYYEMSKRLKDYKIRQKLLKEKHV